MMPAADVSTSAWPQTKALTISAARRLLTERFRAAGIETPELDARVLVTHALSLDHAGLAAAGTRSLDAAEWVTIASFAERRLMHEPVARIVGFKEFWSLRLQIDSTTLVPRPETETLVEAALAEIDSAGSRTRPMRIADLGTGSGAILLALLSELPNAFGVGTDTSFGALRLAQHNAQHLQLGRAAFVACDLGAALAGSFDLIVANPPYIASGEIAALAPDVRDYDPRAALDGGHDGLDCYRAIAATIPALLNAAGASVVELGAGQAAAVIPLFSQAGLAPACPRTDLEGTPRALVARKGDTGAGQGHDRKALDPGKKALGISAGTD
jgi:release factor glutamine methyltransferase